MENFLFSKTEDLPSAVSPSGIPAAVGNAVPQASPITGNTHWKTFPAGFDVAADRHGSLSGSDPGTRSAAVRSVETKHFHPGKDFYQGTRSFLGLHFGS